MLDQAERLSSWGFALHWLRPRSKAPVNDSWSTERVASLATLKKTYREGYNLGVRLGEPSFLHDLYLHCIDLDIRDADKTDEARAALLELIPEARSLPSVISGSLGESRHLYFLTERPFPSKKLRHSSEKIIGKDKKSHWAWEIERFGTGKQVVVPPSVHPDTGKRYKWEREWPADLVELGVGPVISAARVASWEPPSRDETDVRTNPLGLSVADAKDILADLPTDTWREDRDGWLQVGMALHHEFSGSKEGFKLWVEFSAASDKYDPEDQRRVWRSFRQSGKPVRMATLLSAAKEVRLMSAFDDLGDDDDDGAALGETDPISDDVDNLLGADDTAGEQPERVRKLKQAEVHHDLGHVPKRIAKLNKRYACAAVKGKTVILTFEHDGTTSYGSVHDLYNFYENDRVATEKSTEPVTKAWMRHKARRSYPNGIVFAPQGGPEGAYNHWQGFAVEPDPSSSCARFLDHLRENVCAGDETAYQWVIRWLAHMIQRPWEKPGTALVLRGRKGAGKDTIGDYVGGLFPSHHTKISNPEHLVGRFNAHQEKTLLLHVEEGFWAGDKKAEGQLKHVITSEQVMIESKGINAFQVASVLRIMISSNEDWVVPATFDERRFCVLNVADTRAKDTVYFAKLRDEMHNGGRAALLHHLLSLDLTGFDVRNPPMTTGLRDQKLASLRGVEQWLFEVLSSGRAPGDPMFEDVELSWDEAPIKVSTDDFRLNYEDWLRRRRYQGDPLNAARFGTRVHQIFPSIAKIRPRSDGKRQLFYVIPCLSKCRAEFEKMLGCEVDWASEFSETDDLLG
ncbi:DUF5906 domain-containing protein [Bradyrhizobium sp. WSM3983]|uniref:DUF5906 domain-containing protein n=1 Tax=Bradyrhizobium sp. WSM3983 TaxID=1038867 RepID=UPI00040DCC98|nr:DUF5906 domain-containing protein [Bradyrhizobium sp. WSM3983]